MARKKIGLVGAGQIGGNLALLCIQKRLGDVVLYDIPQAEGLAKGKALDIAQFCAVDGYEGRLEGTSNFADLAGSDVLIITAGIPRKPGMSREDLLGVNLKIMTDVATKAKQSCPKAFAIVISNPLDAMVYAYFKITSCPKSMVCGQAGVLDSSRFRFFVSEALGCSIGDVHALVLGGHGDDMVPVTRYCSVGSVPLDRLLPKDKLANIVQRTRDGGAELVKLYQTGSAYYAPAAAAVTMAESYLLDQKRILPCAAYCEGQYGVSGYFMGVPAQIGAGGVEKVLELELDAAEKAQFEKSFASVKNTVAACKL